MIKRRNSGQPFNMLVGLNTHRRSFKNGQIASGGKMIQGQFVLDPVGGIYPASGSFVVADNDFTTGRVILTLGNYTVQSDIDFAVGAGVNDTAANIAAVINNLPGFRASNNTATVTVDYYNGTANDVDFKAAHYGTKLNLSTFTPATGYLTVGNPSLGAPTLA